MLRATCSLQLIRGADKMLGCGRRNAFSLHIDTGPHVQSRSLHEQLVMISCQLVIANVMGEGAIVRALAPVVSFRHPSSVIRRSRAPALETTPAERGTC